MKKEDCNKIKQIMEVLKDSDIQSQRDIVGMVKLRIEQENIVKQVLS